MHESVYTLRARFLSRWLEPKAGEHSLLRASTIPELRSELFKERQLFNRGQQRVRVAVRPGGASWDGLDGVWGLSQLDFYRLGLSETLDGVKQTSLVSDPVETVWSGLESAYICILQPNSSQEFMDTRLLKTR